VLILSLNLASSLGLCNHFWLQDTTGGIGLKAFGCALFGMWILRIASGSFKGRCEDLWVKIQKNIYFRSPKV
jgi:hypothetical protein